MTSCNFYLTIAADIVTLWPRLSVKPDLWKGCIFWGYELEMTYQKNIEIKMIFCVVADFVGIVVAY